jgi:hypothetical protein
MLLAAATLVTQELCFANDCVINNHCAAKQDRKLCCLSHFSCELVLAFP